MDEEQEAARRLVREMMRATGLDPTSLARKAGVSPSTLTRLMAGSVKHTLSVRTLAKLSRATGIEIPVAPPLDESKRELLGAYDAMNEEQRWALLTMAKGIAGQNRTEEAPPAPRPKPRAVGCVVLAARRCGRSDRP
jgi:transcriptional regulator with XRE-family HTH domain